MLQWVGLSRSDAVRSNVSQWKMTPSTNPPPTIYTLFQWYGTGFGPCAKAEIVLKRSATRAVRSGWMTMFLPLRARLESLKWRILLSYSTRYSADACGASVSLIPLVLPSFLCSHKSCATCLPEAIPRSCHV